jgi:integrase/recombinase XerD
MPRPRPPVTGRKITANKKALSVNQRPQLPAIPRDLSSEGRVEAFLSKLLPAVGRKEPAAALVPWVCDRLVSPHSRKAYASDLARFVTHLRKQGIDPLRVTGDHVRIYKEALRSQGNAAATTISRALSVIRGTYAQFGKRGLIDWETVGDIQAVEAPRVEKNLTPALSEAEARRLLHAPDENTPRGIRDYALLFTFFVTACRVSALVNAKVGDIEKTDTHWYLVVREKGGKRQRKALLQSADALLRYVEWSGISHDLEGPLFRPLAKDRKLFEPRHLTRGAMLQIVKQYCRQVGINPDRIGRRGLGVHTLRKTALTNALEHGAKIEQVQALAGHSDIRTTQLYYRARETDAEDAARHIQIR